MPTVANLFGLDFNYSEVFGADVLENDTNIVRFADMSFVSRYFSYDSLSEQYYIEDGYEITEADLVDIYHQIINDYMYNLIVLQYDIFKEDSEETDE